MAQKLNITLSLTADATQAKAQIKLLQTELKKLSETGGGKSGTMLGLTKEVNDAISKVNELRAVLNKATDATTGKLDLSRFNQALMKSGTSLKQYRDSLLALGPQGQKAFTQLATSIANADARILKAHGTMKAMLTTLGNTLRWTVAAGAIHTFTGSIQTALGYAQDLDKSLNKIRIVSGQSAQQMADFAAQANKAAQALSTTTTAYTDAALIFFQAGLSGEEVTKRTETVIKMAQVTGDSVEEVSSYMTAVWNNFDNGSKSLEYYADVIAQLGAKTAASSSEISQGLEKFAAVAETAGLSYEYATSALATVVATTRQSADTVGTAFKTLFARIQDLELGKTLDDGTTLGKYSQALESVGVNIKDVNGDLKDMDTILDELGARWGTLGNDIQVAVAQAVGGTRQYNQLMSLMENWDVMKQNVEYAREAEGTVQRQADIYAESWEAAQKRIKAASQEIYDSLIDEKFFISVDDTITKLLKGTAGLIQNLGGVQGVISTLAAFILSKFNGEIATGIDNLIIKFKDARQDADSIRTNAVNLATEGLRQAGTKESDKVEYEALKERLNLQLQFIQNSKKMSEIEQSTFRYGLDNLTVLKDKAVEQQKIAEAKKEEYDASLKLAQSNAATPIENDNYYVKQLVDDLNSIQDEIDRLESINSHEVKGQIFGNSTIQNMAKQLPDDQDWQRANEAIQETQQKIQELKKELQEKIPVDNIEKYLEWMKEAANDAEKAVKDTFTKLSREMQKATRLDIFKKDILNLPKDIDKDSINQIKEVFKNIEGFTPEQLTKVFGKNITEEITLFNKELNETTINYEKLQNIAKAFASISIGDFDFRNPAIEDFTNKMKILGSSQSDIDKYIEKIQNAATEEERAKIVTEALTKQEEALRQKSEEVNNQPVSIGQKITQSVQALSSLSMALNTISGSMKTLSSEDASGLQKFSAAIMLATTSLRAIQAVQKANNVLSQVDIGLIAKKTKATIAETVANFSLAGSLKAVGTAMSSLLHSATILTTVLLVATAVTEGLKNAAINAADAKIELANKSIEASEKNKEEIASQRELYKTYKEALNAYQTTGQGKRALIEAAGKAAEAYQIEDAAVAILTDDYKKLSDALKEVDNAKLQQSINEEQNIQNQLANRAQAVSEKQSAEGTWISWLLNKGDVIGGIFGGKYQRQAEADLAAENINAQFNDRDIVHLDERGKAVITLQGSATDMIKQYEAILNQGDSTLVNGLADLEDIYEKLKDSVKSALSQQATLIANNIENIDNYEAYSKTIKEEEEKLVEQYGESAKEALSSALYSSANSSFEALRQAFSDHKNWEEIYNAMNKEIEDTSSFISFMNLFPDADLNEARQKWDEYKDAFEEVQKGHEIQLKFTAAENALDLIKEKMSDPDWEKFTEETTGLGWSEEFRKTFKEAFTFEEQKQFLENIKDSLGANLSQAIAMQIEGTQKKIQQLQKDLEGSTEERATVIEKDIADYSDVLITLQNEYNRAIKQEYNKFKETIDNYYKEEIDKLKDGDTISVELVTYLKEIGIENLEKYLSYMGDGTYKLVQAAEEFVNVTKQAISKKELSSALDNSTNLRNIIDSYNLAKENGPDQIQTQVQTQAYTNYANSLSFLKQVNQNLIDQYGKQLFNNYDFKKEIEDKYSDYAPGGSLLSEWANNVLNLQLFDSKEAAQIQKDLDLYNTLPENIDEILEAQKRYQGNESLIRNMQSDVPNQYEIITEDDTTKIDEAKQAIRDMATNYGIIDEKLEDIIPKLQKQVELEQRAAFENFANSFTNLTELDNAFSNYIDDEAIGALDAYIVAWNKLNTEIEYTNVDTQKLAEYTEHLLDVADDADQGLLSRFLDEDTANDIAKEVLRMNSGLEALTANFEKWNDVLQNSSKTSQEYAAALEGLRAAAADLFDVNKDFISSEFLVDPDNLTAFQEAMNGSEEAIDSLKVKLTESIVQGFDITSELKSGLNEAIANIQQDLATLKIGGEVNPEFLRQLEDAAKKANLTATEFEALADAMGIDVEYATQEVKVPHESVIKHHEIQHFQMFPPSWDEVEWQEPGKTKYTTETLTAWSANGEKPSIKGATKKATGVMANNSSLNKGGNVSSPKKPVKGDKSQFKTEVERYHEINKVLEDMERKLKRIENVKSKAFGPDKIKAIKDEVGMLNAENKAYKERLREANEYLQMDRAKVLSLGAQLDENGIITNYSQVAASLNNQYNQGYVEYINAQNAAIAAYNQTGNQDAYDKALDAINEKWKAVQQLNKENVDALKQYEDTIKQIEEDEIKLEELKQQKYEAEIEEIEVRVNLKVSLSETQMKRIDFQLKLLGDDIDKATDRILKYGETADAQVLNAGAAEEGIRRILSHAGADEDLINRYMTTGLTEEDLSGLKLTEKDVELLEGYTDKLISAYGTIMEQQKKVWEEVDKVLQETTDEFEKLNATFERISKRLGSYQNIINTVGKNILDPTGELTRAIATAQIDISRESALNRKNQLDTYKTQAEALRKAIAEGTQKGTKEEAENRLKEMEKTISETENLYLEEINNLAEAWKTAFDLANQQIFENFEKQATGAAGSFEFLNMQYDFAEELADQVVPEYERIYDLSKLTRDITNSINDGKLIAGNEKLAQLQDDITAEMNNQEMSSKYSLDYLRMRYELLLAEMQLEEARNNKTSLKLKRDSQGNYSYQYGVDEDAINNAQQNYEDKLYAMQKFNDDFIQEQQKLLATIPEQMTQALAALDPGDPQYDEKRQAIIDHYQKLYDTVAENLQRALGNQRTLYLQDWSAYNKATGYKISSEEEFMDTFEETLLSQTTGYKDLGDLRAAFTAATLSENEALTDSHNRYTEGIKNDLEECGLDTQKFSEIVYTALGQANKEIAETGRISDETREKFSAMSTSVIADATKTSDEIELKAKAIAAAAEATVTSLEKFRKKAVELADAINDIPNSFEKNYKLVYTTVYNTEGKEFDTSSFGDSGQGGNKLEQELLRDTVDTNNRENLMDLYLVYDAEDRKKTLTYAKTRHEAEQAAAALSLQTKHLIKIANPWSSYDTGGYTGNWNSSEGRLAMLHQKELVLNASDTSNMLEMVSAVRDLAGAAQANVAGNIAQMIADNIASALYNTTTINNGMQQQVTINADFPAATSAYEIETALNSLVNKATQRAGISQNYR